MQCRIRSKGKDQMKVNLNASQVQIVVSVLMKAVAKFPATDEGKKNAIELAKKLWASGKFVEVTKWQSGCGQLLFKRTAGHCFG